MKQEQKYIEGLLGIGKTKQWSKTQAGENNPKGAKLESVVV